MKPRKPAPKRPKSKPASTKTLTRSAIRRAAIFRNGANQAVRLPQELRFPEGVKEVQIRQQGASLLISPIKPDWASFFALNIKVPNDFLERRDDTPSQSREPL
jgi:antitoxin VapB